MNEDGTISIKEFKESAELIMTCQMPVMWDYFISLVSDSI